MRLIDLDPRWVFKDGQRVGFIFKSPTNPDWYQACLLGPSPPRREQWDLFRRALEIPDEDYMNVQGCSPGTTWQIAPDISTADFANLTVTPSLDGSKGGLWHGLITNGEIVGGI